MLSIYTLLEHDYLRLGHVYFYFLSTFLVVDFIRVGKINLLHVWLAAFQFIIISEINTSHYLTFLENILPTVKYFMVANNLVILGYYSNTMAVMSTNDPNDDSRSRRGLKKSSLVFMIALTAIYFAYTLPFALKSYVFGRGFAINESSTGFVGSVIDSFAYVLPAAYAYYFMTLKKSRIVWAIILSTPIWFLLFLIGTRFPLLFSVLGLAIVSLSLKKNKLTLRNYIFLGLGVILLFFSSIIMKQVRDGFEPELITMTQIDNPHRTLPQKVGAFGSNERVVDITTKLITYYEHPDNHHELGKASSFIFYFWVPRIIWPEKPTMLGYWFIRKVEKVSEHHSAALGFTGELFVDFGYYSLIAVFFIGWGLKASENFFIKCTRSRSLDLVIGAMFYPMLFFFVRSPITSLMSFVGIILIYLILKNFFYHRIERDF